MRLAREIDKRLNAETTHFYQDKAVSNLEDNATRMRATELLADLLGKRKADVTLHTDTVEIVPPAKPEDQVADED